MDPRISIVTLGVENLDASMQFYHHGLGLPISDEIESIVFLDLGGVQLALYPRDSLAEEAQVPPFGSGFRGVTLAHNVSSEAEVDAVVEEAISAGASLVKEPQDTFWGGYSGYFADPDGHLWEVAYNPNGGVG